MCLGHSSKIPAVRVMTALSAQASRQTSPVHNLLAFRAGACYRKKPVFSSYSLWFVTGALAFPVCKPGEVGFSFLWLRHWRASNGVVRTRGTARVLSVAQPARVKDFRQDQKTKKQRVRHCFFAFFVSKMARISSFCSHPVTVSEAPLPIRVDTVERYCPTVQPLMLLAAREELGTRLLRGVLLVAVAIFDPADVPNI